MGSRAFEQAASQPRQLGGIQLRRPAFAAPGPQCIDAAFIKQCLRGAHHLPSDTNGMRNFGATLTGQQKPTGSHAPTGYFVHLFRHA
jgi:hypothetical protein